MYCTLDDLISRFGSDELLALTDKEHSGIMNTEVAEAAIQDASATVDGYLSGRYTLPLSVVPVLLVRLSANLARYQLYDNGAPEQVAENYKDAIRYLEQVASGKVTLGLDSQQQQADTEAAIEIQSGGNVWGRKQSKGFI